MTDRERIEKINRHLDLADRIAVSSNMASIYATVGELTAAIRLLEPRPTMGERVKAALKKFA